MKSVENKTALIFDLFFCFVFMPILLILGPAHHWIRQWPLFFVIVLVYLYGSYFLLTRMNMPQLLISKRYYRIIGIFVGLVAFNYLLSMYPLPAEDFVMPTLSEYQTRVRDFGVTMTLWMMFSLVIGYSMTTAFVRELYDQLLMKRKIEAQRDKAELAVFKAQISPHFLFNTLNSLYSLVIGTSEKAEDAFVKFTELLRYTYVTVEKETVALADEIAYIRNYVDLQMIRLNGKTRVFQEYDTDNDAIQVPPMLMLTFVENAFKYGASTSIDCEIHIRVSLRNRLLEFSTRNSIMRHADEFRTDVPVGVENCRARLAALFPGRHSLLTRESAGIYSVELRIDLANGKQ